MTLGKYTTEALLEELENRRRPLTGECGPTVTAITPYDIMCKMIDQQWKEDPRQEHSDERIDRMWDYLGYPNFTDDQSYCAATVNCCLKLAGYPTSDCIPVARSFMTYAKTSGDICEGDIVVFEDFTSTWKGHVGFIKTYDPENKSFLVAGGNQKNKMCYDWYRFRGERLGIASVRKIQPSMDRGKTDIKTLTAWGLI